MATLFATETQWRSDGGTYADGDYLIIVPDGTPSRSGTFSYRRSDGRTPARLLRVAGTAYFTIPNDVTITGTVPVSGPLTDEQLRDDPIEVTGTIATGGLTDAELRATPVSVSVGGVATQVTLAAILAALASVVVTGPLTDAQLRAAPVPVSDAAVLAELVLILTKLSSDPATQTTLAAVVAKLTADPSTGTLQTAGNGSLTTIAAKDFATQTTLAAILAKLIAAPATEATLAALVAANHTDLAAILTKLNASLAVTGTFWQATQPVSGTFFQSTQPVSIVQPSVSFYDSAALENAEVIKASAGSLYNISGYNSNASKQWIMLFNSTSVPADTTFPLIVIAVDGKSNFYWSSGSYPKTFSTGITACNSTTDTAKTIGAADVVFNAQFS